MKSLRYNITTGMDDFAWCHISSICTENLKLTAWLSSERRIHPRIDIDISISLDKFFLK